MVEELILRILVPSTSPATSHLFAKNPMTPRWRSKGLAHWLKYPIIKVFANPTTSNFPPLNLTLNLAFNPPEIVSRIWKYIRSRGRWCRVIWIVRCWFNKTANSNSKNRICYLSRKMQKIRCRYIKETNKSLHQVSRIIIRWQQVQIWHQVQVLSINTSNSNNSKSNTIQLDRPFLKPKTAKEEILKSQSPLIRTTSPAKMSMMVNQSAQDP
jgi:hypothetical protein